MASEHLRFVNQATGTVAGVSPDLVRDQRAGVGAAGGGRGKAEGVGEMMELREKVARALSAEANGADVAEMNWRAWLHSADAAIAAMPQAPADDEARWVIEQTVRLLAIPSAHRTDGKTTTLPFAVDAVRAELSRLRQDGEGT